MPHLHRKLRARLVECGMDQLHYARELRRGVTYISLRLNAKAPWDTDDIYGTCRALDIPYNEIHLYFPPNGKEASTL